MTFLLGFTYLIVTGAVLASMAVLFLRGKRELANQIYIVCQGMVAVWCSSQIMVLLSETKWQLMLSYLFGNIGICFVGAFWYYFAVLYTGGGLRGLRKYAPIALSAAHYLIVLTNEWHHLYYARFSADEIAHGPFFYTNVLETYIFVVMGAVIIFRNIGVQDDSDTEGKPGHAARVLVVMSVLVPVAFNAIYLTGLVRADFDITPLGFAASVILTMLATVKYRFIDIRKELAITNEKLILEKERNRIAQQVHDTAGHTLTMIQSYMKLAEIANKGGEQEQVGEYLKEARGLTGQGIKELRESINQLRSSEDCELVTQRILQLAAQVKEIPVEVTVKGEDSDQYCHLSRVLYDCVRETVTNTLKYAEASRMEIVIRFQKDFVELVMGDDGKGCENLVENNGIRGIRERVEQSGGSVRFISENGEGFLTRIHIPTARKRHLIR